MSARSMTGFGEARRTMGDLETLVSLRSVNHRSLDLHFHLPPALAGFESAARAAIRERMARGRVEVRVTIDRHRSQGGAALNTALLERWAAAYREAARLLGSDVQPSPGEALKVPGVFELDAAPEPDETLGPLLADALAEALDAFDGSRRREGLAIAEDLRSRAEALLAICSQFEKVREQATGALRVRLQDRLSELLRGAAIDPQRLAQEVAILADRSDISEEIVRLKTHAAQTLALLAGDGERGKKLDFLFQEMNRESNTALSKTSGLGDHGLTLTDLGLQAKAEIEKMREQALNLE